MSWWGVACRKRATLSPGRRLKQRTLGGGDDSKRSPTKSSRTPSLSRYSWAPWNCSEGLTQAVMRPELLLPGPTATEGRRGDRLRRRAPLGYSQSSVPSEQWREICSTLPCCCDKPLRGEKKGGRRGYLKIPVIFFQARVQQIGPETILIIN